VKDVTARSRIDMAYGYNIQSIAFTGRFWRSSSATHQKERHTA
jgi:hypothetical protein